MNAYIHSKILGITTAFQPNLTSTTWNSKPWLNRVGLGQRKQQGRNRPTHVPKSSSTLCPMWFVHHQSFHFILVGRMNQQQCLPPVFHVHEATLWDCQACWLVPCANPERKTWRKTSTRLTVAKNCRPTSRRIPLTIHEYPGKPENGAGKKHLQNAELQQWV